MLLGNVTGSNLKRPAVECHASVKKIKAEDRTEETEEVDKSISSPQTQIKPLTRGVERIHPYPVKCRPSNPHFEWHRRQLVKDVTASLGSQGKRVVGLPKFLDDGITFDWMLDGSLVEKIVNFRVVQSDESSSTSITGPSTGGGMNLSRNSYIARKSDDQHISSCESSTAGLEHFQISLHKPAQQLDKSPINANKTVEHEDSVTLDAILFDGVEERQNPDVTSEELSEQDCVSDISSSSESPSSQANDYGFSSVDDSRLAPRRDLGAPVTREPSEQLPVLREFNKGMNMAMSNKPVTGQMSTLKSINWDNYRSIIMMKGLPGGITMVDVYTFLSNYGINFQSIKQLLLHNREKSGDTMSSIEFHTAVLAQEALVKLRGATWRSFVPSTSTSTSIIRPKVEPCQRPKWYLDSLNRPSSGAHLENGSGIQLRERSARPRNVANAPAHVVDSRIKSSGLAGVEYLQRTTSLRRVSEAHSRALITPSSVATELTSSNRMPKEVIEIDSTSDTEDNVPSETAAHKQSHDDSAQVSVGPLSDGNASSMSSLESQFEDDNSDRTVSEHEDDENSRHTLNGPNARLKLYSGAYERSESIAVERRAIKLANVTLPKVSYGRPRRILLPRTKGTPVATVSLRGDVQFVDSRTKSRLHTMSLPALEGSKGRVEDACILGDIGIIGYSGKSDQLDILTFNEAKGKAVVRTYTSKVHDMRGISCLGPIFSSSNPEAPRRGQPLEFLSGGFDKFVRRWRVTPTTRPGEDTPSYSAAVHQVSQEHNSTITSVAWHDYDNTFLSAAGAKLWTTDGERGVVLGNPSVVSNLINEIHVHPLNPHTVILEVAHPYIQVQIFDIRQGYSGKPIMTLGYADTSLSAKGVRARHRKGDTTIKHFVRGFDDGTIALWDYRNPKTTLKVHQMQGPVYHTVFTNKKSTDVWAFAGNQLDYIGNQ